jgi:hypothetical protein
MAATNGDVVSNVKWSLESWREVVILADKMLCWERDWYAGIVAG